MGTTTVNPETPTTGNFGLDPHAEPRYQAEPERTALRRPLHDHMLTGVAAGLAGDVGVDVMVVRVALVVLTVVGGAGIPLYLVGLLLIPEEGSGQSIADAFVGSRQSRSR
jgi:phage shock protein PspC (stress-responsive transcriptional regulator)